MLRSAIRQIRKRPCEHTLFYFLDLIREKPSYKLASVKAGIIELFMTLISPKPESRDLTNAVMFVIRELSLDFEVSKKLYLEYRFLNLMIDILTMHEDSSVVEHILAIFSNIILLTKKSLLSFVKGDIVELIVNTAIDFINDPVVQAEVCLLFERLARVDPKAKDYLGRKGAVNIAVQALELYGKSMPDTKQMALNLLTFLVTEHKNNTYIAMKLDAHRVLGDLIENAYKQAAATKLGASVVLAAALSSCQNK